MDRRKTITFEEKKMKPDCFIYKNISSYIYGVIYILFES